MNLTCSAIMAVYFLSYGPNLVPVSRIIAENDPHLFPTRRRSTDNVMRTNFLIPVPKKNSFAGVVGTLISPPLGRSRPRFYERCYSNCTDTLDTVIIEAFLIILKLWNLLCLKQHNFVNVVEIITKLSTVLCV